MRIIKKSGARSSAAYEVFRLRPDSQLARFLMESTLDDVFESALEGRADTVPTDGAGILSRSMDEDTVAPEANEGAAEVEHTNGDRKSLGDGGESALNAVEPPRSPPSYIYTDLSAGLFGEDTVEMKDEMPPPNRILVTGARDNGESYHVHLHNGELRRPGACLGSSGHPHVNQRKGWKQAGHCRSALVRPILEIRRGHHERA